jgi:FAD:protein FMN transferase
MASELHLVTVADGDQVDPGWWASTVDLLEHLEARWSRFLRMSDVSRLNLACGQPVQVDPATVTLVTTMVEAWRATGHRFDPTTLPALVATGYHASIDDPRRVTILASGGIHVSGFDETDPTPDDIDIDPAANTIRLPLGLVIDPGGIGKGLAADLAVAHALRSGAAGSMISIGGDIAMGGRPPELGWTVHVEHPDRDRGHIGSLEVSAGGVATSSVRSRRWYHDGDEHHHVIDPSSGAPSTTDLAAVTVIARSGWLAEAHATGAILAGSAHVLEYLDVRELSALAVTADGSVLATGDLCAFDRDPAVTSPTMGAPA